MKYKNASANHIDSTDEVIVRKIIFRNEENGWSVIWAVNKNGNSYTMVGCFPFVANGCWFRINGQFISHPTYGHQFKVLSHEEIGFKDKASLKIYLFNLLGSEVLAQKIVAEFGLEALNVMDQAPETVKTIRGISDEEAATIAFTWQKSRYIHKISNNLSQYGINIEQAYKIYNKYGHSALDEINNNPYCICNIIGIPFDLGDAIALQRGLSPGDPVRLRALVYFALVRTAQDGHTVVNSSTLDPYISSLSSTTRAPVTVSAKQRGDALAELVEEQKVVIEGNQIYLRTLKEAESFISDQMLRRVGLPPVQDLAPDMTNFDKELDDSQKIALEKCLKSRICILTGAAGTGKTTISKAILDTWQQNAINFAACCPTGIGTKQIELKTGHKAKTIHRTFKFFPLEEIDNFIYKPELQLTNRDAILIDELSMVDIPLFCGMLSALPEDIRIIMVGDFEQLPSVGPGNLLQDLIESGQIPVAHLKKPHRSAENSSIISNANLIREGKPVTLPRPNNYNGEDMLMVVKNDKDSMLNTIKQLMEGFIKSKGYTYDDVQILCPLRKTDMGSVELNKALQEFFNPGPYEATMGNSNFAFHVGDRIIQIENNYEKEIYNGDTGKVEDIGHGVLYGRFLDYLEDMKYSKGEMSQLELSNCLTIHKSQGSEFPVVIVLCHQCFGRMLRRRVYYTGVTRAQELCIIVGQESALREAIANDKETPRMTKLKTLLEAGKT